MTTRYTRWLLTGLLIAGVGVGLTFAQNRERIAPQTLLPEQSLIYVGVDGTAEHEKTWQQTAAYEALYKSGLMDVVTKLFTAVQEQSGGEAGIPGQFGAVLKHVMDHGVSFALTLGEGGGRPPVPWAVLVLHDAAPFEAPLGEMVVGSTRGDVNFETTERNGRTITSGLIPRSPGIEVGWWSEGDHLVVVAGIEAVRSALIVADGGANISANPLWNQFVEADADFEVSTVSWFDFKTLRTAFGQMPLPQSQNEAHPQGVKIDELVQLLGLDGLNTIAARTGYKGRAMWSEATVDAPGPRRGLLSMSDQEPFTLADLPPLPQGTSGFSASSIDWAKAYDSLVAVAHGMEEMFSQDEPGQVDRALEHVTSELGFDLREHLLEPLGNVHVVYADSAQAMFGLGFGVSIEVDDASKLRAVFDRLLEILEREAGRDVAIRRVDRDGQEMVLLEFGEGAFSPAFCIGDRWFNIGILPQTVDAFLMREAGTLETWKPTDQLQKALAEVPDEFTAISISDPRATYQFMLGFAPFMLGGAQAGMRQSGAFPPDFEFPLTMADLPPAELVVRPLFPNVSVATVDENGVRMTSRASLAGIPFMGAVDGGTAVAGSAVMVALLLPAVQQAREAARRTQSKNNLKQIMLAMHNYHDVYQEFPPGTHPNEKLKPDERLSWQAKVLPFLDQANLYNQIDFEEGWEDDGNKQLMEIPIATYINPSSPQGMVDGFAATNYVGLAGLGKDGPELPVTSKKAGVFAYNRGTKIRDITDGTSNTIAVSDANDNGPWGAGGKPTIRALTQKPYINGPDGIGGPHTGGLQVGMCDGSVRFISENIDPSVMEALVTIRGGEVIGDF